jgi:hypothetical protein
MGRKEGEWCQGQVIYLPFAGSLYFIPDILLYFQNEKN